MGGRGTFASGNNVAFTYNTVEKIGGVKVLMPSNPKSSLRLPEESHSSSNYLLLGKDGDFLQMRVYNNEKKAIFEIGYHPESKLGSGKDKVLHIHIYEKPGEINHKKATTYKIGPGNEYYEKYKHLFKGVKK